ncbi:MAG: type II toxin-antitoxin system HicA family toxin [Nitrososphaerales archaeon]
MSLPVLSWRKVLKALSKQGFKPVRQRGSHIMLEHSDSRFTVIPRKKQIKSGTPLSIINLADLTKKEFIDLLD